ncbi:hypothetical protein WDU94_000537, partial [Cyamophila willieti]
MNTQVLPTFALPPMDQLLPHFNANDDENPNEFINKFQTALKNYHIPEDTWKTIARNQMHQSARQWFDRNSSRFTSFNTFAELFKQQYNNSTVQTKLKAQFYGTPQSLTENSANFVNGKLKIYKRLFPMNSEEEAIEDIIQLLLPQVQVHLLHVPPTIDDLFLKLEVIDKARNVSDKHKPTAKIEQPKPTFTFVNEKPPPQIKNSPFSNSMQTNQPPPKPQEFIPNCRHCPARHFHRDCPVLKQKILERSNDNSRSFP